MYDLARGLDDKGQPDWYDITYRTYVRPGTPTSLNRSNVTLADMSQAAKSITAVLPEWSKTWDGQPWNSIVETAAWLWCTRSSITRSTLPSHLNTACHSLLPEAMPLVLCSHNAAVLHTQTTSSHALPETGTCYLLIHQLSIPLTPSRATWTSNHWLSIVFNLIELSCWKCGMPGCCAFILHERLHFCGRRRRRRDDHWPVYLDPK